MDDCTGTRITVVIDCENDAFMNGNYRAELASILRGLAFDMENDCDLVCKLKDSNGNTVGTCKEEFI